MCPCTITAAIFSLCWVKASVFMGKNLEKDDDNDGYDNDDSIRMENRRVNPVTKKIEEEEVYIFIYIICIFIYLFILAEMGDMTKNDGRKVEIRSSSLGSC